MRYFLIAGEASGDKLGSALMTGLRELDPGAGFDGIGGPLMQAQGLASRFAMEELSVMGLAEVLPRYFDLKRRIRETAQAVIETRPDALITIDSPDFCLRVARLVREAGLRLPIIHYVAPSVWAWRPGRAAKMARWVDHVLAILPFEPPLMQAAGMSCDFVGHPVVTEPRASAAEAEAFRTALFAQAHADERKADGPHDGDEGRDDAACQNGGRNEGVNAAANSDNTKSNIVAAARGLGAAPQPPLILCLPGSRRGEIARLGPRFAETLGLLARDLPGLRAAIPTLPHLEPALAAMDWPVPVRFITDPAEKRAAFAAADLALAASGTVSLELAANDVPMVIGYDMAPLSRFIIRHLLRVRTVTLVNLVSETHAVPEFLGRACRPEQMAPVLYELATIPAFADAQRRVMALTMARLGAGGKPPGLRAAHSVLGAVARLQRRA